MTKPTDEQFKKYQELYDYFNRKLFEGKLQPILLNFSRKANSCGFFAFGRWKKDNAKTHEISINPVYMAAAPFRDICQTLVHEMCHLWQFTYGKPSRAAYHNKQWADKMESVGLMPSDTGEPGGAKVGQSIADYVIDGGRFEDVFRSMPENMRLPWQSLEIQKVIVSPVGGGGDLNNEEGKEDEEGDGEEKGSSSGKKIKYTCPTTDCKLNVWGKPGINVKCGECGQRLQVAVKKKKRRGRMAVLAQQERQYGKQRIQTGKDKEVCR